MVDIIGQAEPVLMLIGQLIPGDFKEDEDREILLSPGSKAKAPAESVEFLEWITTPRLHSEVVARLPEWDSTEEDLHETVRVGTLLALEPGSPTQLLSRFKGFVVEPIGTPEKLDGADNLTFVKAEEGSAESFPVTNLLASVIWEHKPGEDFPTAVRRLGIGLDQDVMARKAFYGLSGLLELRLARIGIAKRPSVKKVQKKRRR
jgi:hypothetical protein